MQATIVDIVHFYTDGRQPEQTVVTDPLVIKTLDQDQAAYFAARQEADDAYLPAVDLLGPKDGPLYHKLRGLLRRNRNRIRQRPSKCPKTGRPRPNYPEYHVGDWIAVLARGPRPGAMLDLPISILGYYLSLERERARTFHKYYSAK